MKDKHMVAVAILLLLSISSVIPMYSFSENISHESARSLIQSQPTVYINGNWNVTTDTIRSNETIILSGNLTVLNNATLTFRNVTLKINSTSSQYYAIEVLAGAIFRILDIDNDNTTAADASVIERNNLSNPYFFRVYDGSIFEMRNSELHGCGDATTVPKYAGLYIETDNATIDHNLISNNYYGIVLYGSDATVSNNTITWNDDTGIYAGYWSNGTIENNWITWNYDYGIYVTGGGSTGTKPSNPTIIGNVITDTGRGVNTADGIQVLYGSKPLIKDTLILRSKEDGVYSDGSRPTLINVTIDAGGVGNYGIVGSSTGYLYITNSTIKNTKANDLSIYDSYFILTNTTFNNSKVLISNEYSNLTVRWYLHVLVRDSNYDPIPAANVRVRDNENGTYDRNFSTDGNGYVKWIVLTEYWRNNNTIIYYTPYNISVNYTGLDFVNNPRDVDMNVSKTEIFTATTPVPEFENPLIALLITVFMAVVIVRKGERLKQYAEHMHPKSGESTE